MHVRKTFYLDEELVKALELLAESDNRNLNNYVDTVLKKHIQEHEKVPETKEKV